MVDTLTAAYLFRDKPHISQHLQVLGNGRSVQFELRCNVTYSTRAVAQQFEDAPSDRIGQGTKNIGNWHGPKYMSDISDVSSGAYLTYGTRTMANGLNHRDAKRERHNVELRGWLEAGESPL